MASNVKLIAAVALGAIAVAAAPARASSRTVVLGRSHAVFAKPDRDRSPTSTVSRRRPITRVRTVLPVLRASTDADGRRWLRVRLPGRPNGHSGWISSRFTRAAATPWRLRVDLSARRVVVFHDGRVRRRLHAVVGKPSTPTPRGRFFVEESVRLDADRSGAPFALALSARSEVYSEFDGGPGQIALHGTGNIGGVPGTAVSHGCVRLDARSIRWLAARIGPGVPVTVVG